MQGKRKSSKPPPKKVAPKLDKLFTCPFCNHEKAVSAKLNFETEIGTVQCNTCGVKWETNITTLSDAIDVYSDWIDSCESVNRPEAATTTATR